MLTVDDKDPNFVDVSLVRVVIELLSRRLPHTGRSRFVKALDGPQDFPIQLPPLALEDKMFQGLASLQWRKS